MAEDVLFWGGKAILVAACAGLEARVAAVSYFMAKTLGEAGRYVSEQATKRLHSMWAWGIFGMAGVGVMLGFVFRGSCSWVRLTALENGILTWVALLGLVLLARVMFRRFRELEKERDSMRKGADGEDAVGVLLSGLPDDYRVINDIATPTGNLDHVVIGPTGVFVIETKNCRGVVGADKNGELTLNGKPAAKRHVARLVGRMMSVKERVRVLAPEVDVYFNAVMVFTSAWVDAKFGTTGKAFCIRDDRLRAHIVEYKAPRKLAAKEVEMVAGAFASLARMDSGFERSAEPVVEGACAEFSNQGSGCAAGARG